MEAADLAELLVRSDVLTFGDFVTKSGRPTPYFLNFGRIRTGRQIEQLAAAYADTIAEAFPDADVLFGPAYKGIPLVVATSIALRQRHGIDVGFCFNRKEPKDHGEGGVLVGAIPQDRDRVVIVEDVTTAGTSIRETVPVLRGAADVDLVGLVIAVDRAERGTEAGRTALQEIGEEFGFDARAITDIDTIVAYLADHDVDGRRHVGPDDLARIRAYRAEYGA